MVNIPNISNELIAQLFIPAFNLIEVRILQPGNSEYLVLPDRNGCLPYVLKNMIITFENTHISIKELFYRNYSQILSLADYDEKEYRVEIDPPSNSVIPVLEEKVIISSIIFLLK